MLPGPPILAALRVSGLRQIARRSGAGGVVFATLLALLLPAVVGAGETERSSSASGSTPGPSHTIRQGVPYDASDPGAPPVTEKNLLQSERFWPYHVKLLETRKVEGAKYPIPPVIPGVLIRIEEGNVARVDFGRRGKLELPVAQTNIVEQANRVRVGELPKMAPNFVLAIGNRIYQYDEASGTRPFRLEFESSGRRFLCVFADPESKQFAKIAASLEPFREREKLITILFQQTEREHPLPDPKIGQLLRKHEWPVLFSASIYAAPFERSLLRPDVKLPYLLLQTEEGRVLFEGPWHPGVAQALGAALAADERGAGPQQLGSAGTASQ